MPVFLKAFTVWDSSPVTLTHLFLRRLPCVFVSSGLFFIESAYRLDRSYLSTEYLLHLESVFLKRTKSSQVAMNHMFPYTSSDPSGGPIKTASIHTYVLPDLLSSLTLFPMSKEYWYKRMLIPVQNGYILCHLILIFSYLQVLGPLACRGIFIFHSYLQETNKIIPLQGTAGFLSSWS